MKLGPAAVGVLTFQEDGATKVNSEVVGYRVQTAHFFTAEMRTGALSKCFDHLLSCVAMLLNQAM